MPVKHKLFQLFVFAAGAFLMCCQSAPEEAEKKIIEEVSEIEKLSWITGVWQDTVNVNQWEEWESNDDSLFGFAGFVKNGDTTIFETLSIVKKDSNLVYTAILKKNKKPVSFTSTIITDRAMVFENPSHDFPKKISYQLLTSEKYGDNNLVQAIVSAEDRRLEFIMIRHQ